MNENMNEKKNGEEQTLNEELLAKIAGGEIDEDWILNGSYVCPMCGKNHRFRFTPILGWMHYDIFDEGNHCEKIHQLFAVTSISNDAKTGIMEMIVDEGKRVSVVFFIVGR